MSEPITPEMQFLMDVGKTAAGCADDYFQAVANLPEEAPEEVWAAHWEAAWGTINQHIPEMCRRLGFDPLTADLVLECALDAFQHRFDTVNEAIIERNGRKAN
ncbi:hypothetical protein [uncultured Devosia sp.]|uniref:hypothetical protein n=1 Tax=uncultured Devosia sp. TaxID=211434 RepID=UPI0035CAAD9A